jgi:excisionase family DNA binding protein
MAERLASALVDELLALSDEDLRPLADRLAPFLAGGEPGTAFLSVDEAAARLGVHPNTVYRMIVGGRLRATRAGRLWRIPEAELGRVSSPGAETRRPRAGRAAPAPSRRFARLVRDLPYPEPDR